MNDADSQYCAVRDVYNTHRTIRMNLKYYGRRVAFFRRIAFAFDAIIAVGVSSSFAGLNLWQVSDGKSAWTIIAAMSALAALVRPFLGLNDKIERYGKLWAGYNLLDNSIRRIVSEIAAHHGMSTETESVFKNILGRADQLATGDDPDPNRRLLRMAQRETNTEIPVGNLWWPSRNPV